MDPMDWSDATIAAATPALVEAMKRAGLPAAWAGLAAVLVATALVGLRAAATGGGGEPWPAVALRGALLGLASAGAYTQLRRLPVGIA
jgi:predicted aconitase